MVKKWFFGAREKNMRINFVALVILIFLRFELSALFLNPSKVSYEKKKKNDPTPKAARLEIAGGGLFFFFCSTFFYTNVPRVGEEKDRKRVDCSRTIGMYKRSFRRNEQNSLKLA